MKMFEKFFYIICGVNTVNINLNLLIKKIINFKVFYIIIEKMCS
jgi:hypothetical protein